ncbi:MAG: DUF992 domain-containing protein [Pseudolabrys sp.]
MHIVRNLLATFVLAIVVAPASAQSGKPWTQVGMLTCKLNPSIGFIIAGHQSMECRYVPGAGGSAQAYQGALNMVGINIGISAGGILNWAVLAPTDGIPAGALAGEYVGASADAGFIVGVGTNVLIGGSNRTLALQPISVEGSVAANVALGVSALKLRPAI